MIWMASKKRNTTPYILVFLCLVTSATATCSEPTIENGSTDCYGYGYGYVPDGTTCTVTCWSGYTISGDSTLTCSSGDYGTLPTCTAGLGVIIGGIVGGIIFVGLVCCCCAYKEKKKTRTVTVTEYH